MIYILPTDTCYGIGCALDDKKSYEKIYKIKKRSFDKPLAIMVESFDWLRNNTELTAEQVDFLENYEKPFTVLTQSIPIRLFLDYHDDHEEHLINKDVYEFISFRVANNSVEEKLISQVGPLWLTSANLSGTGESYTPEEIEEDFAYYLENEIIEMRGSFHLDEDTPPSDVFYFLGENLEVEYVRKN